MGTDNVKSEALTRAKAPKLGRFLKEGGIKALQGNKFVDGLKKIGKAFNTVIEIDNKAQSYTPEERNAYNEEMLRQIAIENDYRGL